MDCIFNSHKRGEWIQDIVNLRNALHNNIRDLHIYLSVQIARQHFEPFHFVTLSCVIEEAKQHGIRVWLNCADKNLRDFIFDDARIREYLTNPVPCVFHSPENSHFNLWKIDDVYYTNYCIALNQFFENTYFVGKDLSGLNNCITELIQNVIDHSNYNGKAFFCISYDERARKINIAICDFGKGIARTLNRYGSDKEALRMSLKSGITANTHKHNRGYGMSNIISTMTKDDIMRIASNKAMLFKSVLSEKAFDLPFEFCGTLIYMSVGIDSFSDLEYVEQLNFG